MHAVHAAVLAGPYLQDPLAAIGQMYLSGASVLSRDCTAGGCPASEVSGRYSHCADVFSTSLGDHMIIYGGQGVVDGVSLSTLGDAWAYDMTRDSWTLIQDIRAGVMLTSMPSPRSSHSCTIVNKNPVAGTADFLTFGGRVQRQVGSAVVATNEVWRLRLTDQRVTGEGMLVVGVWSRLNASTVEQPVPRFDHTAVAYDGSVLMYGGCEGDASAFDDVWLLDYTGNANASWRALTVGAASVTGTTSPGTGSITPGRRCAHAAAPASEGMLVFGGRAPRLPPGANDPVWPSLSDAWAFNVGNTFRGPGYGTWTRMPLNERNAQGVVLPNAKVNRSDHAVLMIYPQTLLVYGGLVTDETLSTIYVARDWLHVALNAVRSNPSMVTHLAWGPDWRFDHTMVLAPVIRHPRANRMLYYAPLLYAGAGGRKIFDDMWVYDLQLNEWIEFTSGDEAPTVALSMLSSLLFGAVGFVAYACVLVALFARRLNRYLPQSTRPNAPVQAQEAPAHAQGAPRRRGISPDEICTLPRVKWADFVNHKGSESSSTGSGGGGGDGDAATVPGDAEAATAWVEGTSKLEEMEEEDLCAVCLGRYEADDLLIRLPCDHLFHEACIGRWLETDGTCPKCRFNLRRRAGRPSARHERFRQMNVAELITDMIAQSVVDDSPPRSPPRRDEEAGIELVDVGRTVLTGHADGSTSLQASAESHPRPSPSAEQEAPPPQAAPPVIVANAAIIRGVGVRVSPEPQPEPSVT